MGVCVWGGVLWPTRGNILLAAAHASVLYSHRTAQTNGREPILAISPFLFCLFVFSKEGAAAVQVRPTRVLLPRSALATATVALEICGATLSVRPVRPCLTFPLPFLDLSLHFNQVLSRPGPIPLLF